MNNELQGLNREYIQPGSLRPYIYVKIDITHPQQKR